MRRSGRPRAGKPQELSLERTLERTRTWPSHLWGGEGGRAKRRRIRLFLRGVVGGWLGRGGAEWGEEAIENGPLRMPGEEPTLPSNGGPEATRKG
jgi:hypothetical protein